MSTMKVRKFGNPPPGYIAGLGRGAAGFTTRSDIGPARSASEMDPMPMAPRDDGDGPDDRQDYSESQYNEFTGYGGSLYNAKDTYDKEDEEADNIYEAVEKKMDAKRKERRDEIMKLEQEKYRNNKPKLQQQFSDLKRDLATLTDDVWESIPEAVSMTQHKKVSSRSEKFTPVPDSVLDRARAEMQMASIDPMQGITTPMGTMTPVSTSGYQTPMGGYTTPLSGFMTPAGMMGGGGGGGSGVASVRTDLTQIGEARSAGMLAKLKSVGDSISGQSNVDPRHYMDGLKSAKVSSDAEVEDMRKARTLFRAMINSNRKHAPAWIAAVRLEEMAGKMTQARNLALQGCEECATSDDMWLEAARLHPPETGKRILAKAVKHIPTSVKIWVQAAKYETDAESRKMVLRRGLDHVPKSVKLWKAAIELEGPEEARIMLTRAVECVPENVDMWLALARLETYQNARQVLNKARAALPAEPSIWITAAKLEEANGNTDMVEKIIQKAVKALQAANVQIDRSAWIREAENCEKSGSVGTGQAIIRSTIGMGVDDEDRLDTWIDDAESRKRSGHIATARAIYAHALTIFPQFVQLWRKAAELELENNNRDGAAAILAKGVKYCPNAEVLWLMGAKEQWKAGDFKTAQSILQEANRLNPDSEQIWLAAVKLEVANNQFPRARALLGKARQRASSARVWMKSAQLERWQRNHADARTLLVEGLRQYPNSEKMWMMLGQVEEADGNIEAARQVFTDATKKIQNSTPLWLCAAGLEERQNNLVKARAMLERARSRNPNNPDLWIAAVRTEQAAGNAKAASTLLAKALQECPRSGRLWAEAVTMEPRQTQRQKSFDALSNCDNDPYVVLVVARLFWAEHKHKKARSWFNRVCKLNPDFGDAWAFLYKFVMQNEPDEEADIVRRCVEADPRHGERWIAVSKDNANFALDTERILKLVALAIPEGPL